MNTLYVSTGSNPQNVDDMNVYIRGDLKCKIIRVSNTTPPKN